MEVKKINKKIIFVLTFFICVFLTVSAVGAADSNNISANTANDLNTNNNLNAVNTNTQNNISRDGNDINNDIYVSPTGDDSNTGKSNISALKTINASLSKVNESDNAVIHLSEGIFSGDGNNMININFAHNNYNGSLTFVGAGYNKTIIDGEGQYKLFTISADSRVNFINISFINCKDNTGGAITNDGNVSFDACIFDSNNATSYGGSIYTGALSTTTVKNSLFINNYASERGGAANLGGNVSFENTKFINCSVKQSGWDGQGGALDYGYMSAASEYFNIINCEFNNIKGRDGGVGRLLGSNKGITNFNIKNNKFVNCSASESKNADVFYLLNGKLINLTNNTVSELGNNAPFYIYSGSYVTGLNISFMNNETVNVGTSTFPLTATVTDDMGNKISGGYVYFYIDGNQVSSRDNTLENGEASISVTKLLDNGVHVITGYYEGQDNQTQTLNNGAINFYINRTIVHIYVSPNGDDENGTGSADNPYKTLNKAITEGFKNNVNVYVHMGEGEYAADGNTGFNLNTPGYIKIIGDSYNKTTIINNKSNTRYFNFGEHVSGDISNVSFVGGNYYSGSIRSVNSGESRLNITDCIFENVTNALNVCNAKIDNCTFLSSSATVSLSNVTNSIFIGVSGNNALTLRTSNVFNSLFENNSNGAIITSQGVSGHKGISYIIDNCTFINNKGTNGSAIDYPYGSMSDGDLIAIVNNCLFINNTASSCGGAFAIDPTLNITVSNNRFYNNTANYGGAIAAGSTDTFFSRYKGNVTFINNTMEGNNANVEGSEIYGISSNMNVNVVYDDLTTTKLSDKLSATVTDDMGNKISGGYVSFYVDGNYLGRSPLINGTSTLLYVGFSNGTYNLNGTYSLGGNKSTSKKGIITVNIASQRDNVTLYVSPNGSDETGDGSIDNPFKTINYAYEVAIINSKNIFLELLEGNFTGAGNVNLNFSGNINITINGRGMDKTIMDETPIDTVFQPSITLTPGAGKFVLANLTFTSGVIKYNQTNLNTPVSDNIIIPIGVNAYIENVNFTKNNGYNGGVFNNDGKLTVVNSTFFNNGDSKIASAIYNAGELEIVNSSFILNHASQCTIYNSGKMTILSSLFEDDLRSNYMSFYYRIYNTGNAEINETKFVTSNRTRSEVLDIIGRGNVGYGQKASWWGPSRIDNPLFSNNLFNNGTILYSNDIFEDHPEVMDADKNGNRYSQQRWGTDGISVNLMGNTTIVNSTFNNIQKFQMTNIKDGFALVDGCVFNNITNITISMVYNGTNILMSNNVILFNESTKNSDAKFYVSLYQNIALGNISFENNWFGNNSQPIYTFVNGVSKPITVNFTNWLVLTLDNVTNGNLAQNTTLSFKRFDGENLTDYNGNLPVRTFKFESDDGTITPLNGNISGPVNVEFAFPSTGNKTLNVTVDDQVLTYNTTIYKSSKLNITPNVVIGGNAAVITLTDEDSNPIDGDVLVNIDGVDYQVTVTGGKIEFTPEEFNTVGDYDVVLSYKGNGNYLPSNLETKVSVLIPTNFEFSFDNKANVIVKLVDANGNPINNADIGYLINGTPVNQTLVTDDNGMAKISGLSGNINLTAVYDGKNPYLANNKSIEVLMVPRPEKLATQIVSSDFNQTAVDYYKGERGGYFVVALKDSEGNALAGKHISIGFNGKVYNRTTDENGGARLQINLANAGVYTFATAFLGDDECNGSFVVNKITVTKKSSTITVKGTNPVKVRSYRTLTFNLKGVKAIDKSSYVNAIGRTLKVTVNGKTYTLKTDKNGKATLKVRFTKAGTYTIKTAFAGDGTFNAKTMNSKITVRK